MSGSFFHYSGNWETLKFDEIALDNGANSLFLLTANKLSSSGILRRRAQQVRKTLLAADCIFASQPARAGHLLTSHGNDMLFNHVTFPRLVGGREESGACSDCHTTCGPKAGAAEDSEPDNIEISHEGEDCDGSLPAPVHTKEGITAASPNWEIIIWDASSNKATARAPAIRAIATRTTTRRECIEQAAIRGGAPGPQSRRTHFLHPFHPLHTPSGSTQASRRGKCQSACGWATTRASTGAST